MSNLIPPLLSSSPPPIVGPLDEDDDDEFGDFRAAADSYDCDDFSLPPSPQKSPEKELKADDDSKVNLDINSNKSQKVTSTTEMPTQRFNESICDEEMDKDFQDRRKSVDLDLKECEIKVNFSNSQSVSSVKNLEVCEDGDLHEQIEDKEFSQSHVELSDQTSKIQDYSNTLEDDFSNLQCAPPSFDDSSESHQKVSQVDLNPSKSSNEGQSDLNSFSNEENMFDAFSDNVQEKTSNSDDLSELNEINESKTENDEDNKCLDEKDEELNYDNLSDSSVSLRVLETDPKLSDDEFGNFADHFEKVVVDKLPEDEFTDFVNPCPSTQGQAEDDFGDFESSEFAEFSSHTDEKPAFLEIDEKNAVDKSEIILKEIFPSMISEIDEYKMADDTKGNVVFDELKDVTETNALIYQWSKSNSQKMFFKALNIDTRNILYGPAWNCSMPRFAANLGLTPLEPVKTEILTPTPVQNVSSPSNSSQKNNSDIPTAQFDWSGSGLINPLDYSQTMLLDLEQLVASLDIPTTTHPTSNQSPSPSNELLDEWDLWLQSTSTDPPGTTVPEASSQSIPIDFLSAPSNKPESIPSLFDTEMLEKLTEPTLSEGGTTELSKSPFQSPKLIPLRETHISTEPSDLNKPGWLQPTILTPDLPRKETVLDAEDEDEFDDFQMVLPEENKEKNETEMQSAFVLNEFDKFSDNKEDKSEVKNTFVLNELEKLVVNNEMASEEKNTFAFKESDKLGQDKTLHNHEHIFGVSLNNGSIKIKEDDEEFTEFHSSLPQVLKPVHAVPAEPLKPIVQYSAPVTQINWPDPGVTDEDIKNIELSYSRQKEKISKENSADDDEWSDFVSVTNPVKSVLPERTSTPDLPLSVLNLNNVQAPKQPIPVITPSGLVQTKLSSNLTLQPKSVVQTSVQQNMFKPPTTQLQPSIISTQYAANLFSPAPSLKDQDDDDDWSDFVSSQPPPQVNGYQQKSSQMKPPPVNWTNATTNIIMNPTHFEAFPNYASAQKKVATVPTRNTIPSISAIPDLDFIAPKNRTSKK